MAANTGSGFAASHHRENSASYEGAGAIFPISKLTHTALFFFQDGVLCQGETAGSGIKTEQGEKKKKKLDRRGSVDTKEREDPDKHVR